MYAAATFLLFTDFFKIIMLTETFYVQWFVIQFITIKNIAYRALHYIALLKIPPFCLHYITNVTYIACIAICICFKNVYASNFVRD